jgi:long-subunit fatty acid transport protein
MLLALLVIPTIASAQTADDALRFVDRTPGATAYSLGIGGAGLAGVADASAFVVNPAGLGLLTGSRASGSFSALQSTSEGTYFSPGYSSSLEDQLTDSGLGSLSYLFKVPTTQGSMVIGAAINSVQSYSRSASYDGDNGFNSITDYFMPFSDEFSLVEDSDGVFPAFTRNLSFIAFETYAIDLDQDLLDSNDPVPFVPAVSFGTVAQTGFLEDTGRMMELNFGGGVEVAKDVLVGFSLNIPVGSFERLRVLEEDDYLNDNDGRGGTTDFNYLYFSESFSSDLVGVNARFGVSLQANSNMRIGATLETPTYFAIEESYSTILETEFDNGDIFSYGDGTGQDIGSGNFDYTLKTPWKVGMGLQFTAGKANVLADLEWMDWSQLELDSNTHSFESENLGIRNALQAAVNMRVAATYDLENIQLRAGTGYNPDPRRTERFTDEGFPSVTRDRSFASLGIGYRFNERMTFDLAWMVESMEDRMDLYSDVTDAPYVLEEVMRHRVQFGVSFGL